MVCNLESLGGRMIRALCEIVVSRLSSLPYMWLLKAAVSRKCNNLCFSTVCLEAKTKLTYRNMSNVGYSCYVKEGRCHCRQPPIPCQNKDIGGCSDTTFFSPL
jgi:hypothetical protein